MEKYRTGSSYSMGIETVEIERETDASVWINGRRSAKDCEWHKYHDTWSEAKDFLVRRAGDKVSGLINRLDSARDELNKAKNLTE